MNGFNWFGFIFFFITFLLCAQLSLAQNTISSDKNSNIQIIRKRGLSIEACRRIAYDYIKSEDNKTKAIWVVKVYGSICFP